MESHSGEAHFFCECAPGCAPTSDRSCGIEASGTYLRWQVAMNAATGMNCRKDVVRSLDGAERLCAFPDSEQCLISFLYERKCAHSGLGFALAYYDRAINQIDVGPV